MQTGPKAPRVQAPIAWAARRLLATDESVQAVMVVGDDGRVLAHERVLDYYEGDPMKGECHPLLFYVPRAKLLFYVRLSKRPIDERVSWRIQGVIDSPSFVISR